MVTEPEIASRCDVAFGLNANPVERRHNEQWHATTGPSAAVGFSSMSLAALPADAMPLGARALSGPNALVRFTAPFNLSRNPTLSLPCAQSADGPPPSLQFVGKHLGEAMLIQAGAAQETLTAWHDQHPDLTRFS